MYKIKAYSVGVVLVLAVLTELPYFFCKKETPKENEKEPLLSVQGVELASQQAI